MKKILMTTLMGIGLLGVQEAFAISEPDGDNRNMPVTTDAPAASHANLHTLPTVRVVQEALLSVSRTIKDVLARAEHLGFNTLGTAPLYMAADLNIVNASISGITADATIPATGASNGAITFTLKPSEVNRQATFADDNTLIYTPVLSSTGGAIIGWTCTSTLGNEVYSQSWDNHPANKTLDPVTAGLGYPFNGCTYSTPA